MEFSDEEKEQSPEYYSPHQVQGSALDEPEHIGSFQEETILSPEEITKHLKNFSLSWELKRKLGVELINAQAALQAIYKPADALLEKYINLGIFKDLSQEEEIIIAIWKTALSMERTIETFFDFISENPKAVLIKKKECEYNNCTYIIDAVVIVLKEYSPNNLFWFAGADQFDQLLDDFPILTGVIEQCLVCHRYEQQNNHLLDVDRILHENVAEFYDVFIEALLDLQKPPLIHQPKSAPCCLIS